MEAVEVVHLRDVADGHLVADRVPAVVIASVIEKARAQHHVTESAGKMHCTHTYTNRKIPHG